LSPRRDAETAKRFFLKALPVTAQNAPRDDLAQGEVVKKSSLEEGTASIAPTGSQVSRTMPRVINVEKNAAYPKALAELKAAGILPESVELRQVNYLNTLIEQDHRAHQTLEEACDGLLARSRRPGEPSKASR